VKTGGRLVKHARYYWLLLAESHLTKRLFGSMLLSLNSQSLPTKVDAYLAETKSWGGESGSPVFHCKFQTNPQVRISMANPD
jgi:hypothetical protein